MSDCRRIERSSFTFKSPTCALRGSKGECVALTRRLRRGLEVGYVDQKENKQKKLRLNLKDSSEAGFWFKRGACGGQLGSPYSSVALLACMSIVERSREGQHALLINWLS